MNSTRGSPLKLDQEASSVNPSQTNSHRNHSISVHANPLLQQQRTTMEQKRIQIIIQDDSSTQNDQQLEPGTLDSRQKSSIKVVDGREDVIEEEPNQESFFASPNSRKMQDTALHISAGKDNFYATGDSQNFAASMVSALSEETPSPQMSPHNQRERRARKSRAHLNRNQDDDDFERDSAASDRATIPLQEIQLPSAVYKDLLGMFPPNPLLPKSFNAKDDSPRSGGVYKFMKLSKFRGIDHGRSKFREEASKIEKISLPDGVTMKKIFKVINTEADNAQSHAPTDKKKDKEGKDKKDKDKDEGPQTEEKHREPDPKKPEPQMTAFGEIVYLRSNQKDFIAKQKMFPQMQPRDEVLEENLVDVKNLLNNNTSSQAAHGKQPGQKALVNLTGIEPYYQKKDKFDKTLIFESRFESGNLAAALKVNENDYYLALQNDVNTQGNTQWFFFRVSNTKSYSAVRFNMLNLCKPDSLFNEGMKVLIYSEKHAQEKDVGWHRGGTKIAYYPNGIRKEGQKSFRTLYTMTFTYEFEYEDDNVYFAYCYPYTYTELIEELNAIMADPIKQQYVSKKTLTETLAGNKCEMLTITSKQNPENMQKRKGVIITARVHPGESVGSWMMKGALDFLVDPNSAEAEYLRQNFVFKVIPMLNPDGVINGNYRCSLAGCDLNRRWKRPSKVLHPTIFATKQLCQQFSKERDLQIFCDFHGHSRRKNIFMYGCNVPGQPEDTRLFPFIMSQICPFFVYNYSRFGNQKSKESTARMSLFNELKCPAIYTIESSFCGMNMGPFKNYHFSTNNLMQTGRDFCRTLILYLPIQVPRNIITCFQQNIVDLFNHYKIISDSKIKPDIDVENMSYYFERLDKVRTQNKDIQSKHIRKGLAAVLRQTADIFSDGHSSSSAGSDGAPSEDNLDVEEIEKVLPVQEDPDLATKLKNNKAMKKIEEKKDDAQSNAGTNKSDNMNKLQRRNTISDHGLKRKSTKLMGSTKSQKSDKRETGSRRKINLDLHDTQIDEEDNDADDEGAGKTQSQNQNSQKEEEQDVVAELKDQGSGSVHKKRRRRNVESRDVYTQTDRSDYMLIKQRQQEKQKQLLALLAMKNEERKPEDQTKSQSPDKRQAIPLLTNSLLANGNQSQVINQNKLRNELNSLLNSNQKGGPNPENGEAYNNKLTEELIHQQKQGLVNNIMNQYNNQQVQNLLPNSPKRISEGVNFSNYILQNHHQGAGNETHEEFAANSPVAKGSSQGGSKNISGGFSQVAGQSPSKKHRNLIQSRAGAATYANSINQSNNGSSVNNSQQFNQHKLTIGQSNNNAHLSQNFFAQQQNHQRIGLSTAQSAQRNSSLSKQMPKQGHEGDQTKQNAMQKNSQSHSKSNANLQYQSSLNYNQSNQRNQGPQNAAPNSVSSHWYKVSTNNHELTKLFYQLPGGTKNLVSNAIQSQNKPASQQANPLMYTSTKKQNRKISMAAEKKMATPDVTAKKSGNFGQAHIGNELPEIQNQGNYAMVSKTPNQHVSKSLKRASNNGLPTSSNTGPPKQKQLLGKSNLFDQPQNNLEHYQASLQNSMHGFNGVQQVAAADTSLNSLQLMNNPKNGTATGAGSYEMEQSPGNMTIQMQKLVNTSKKPPIKSKLSGSIKQMSQQSNIMPNRGGGATLVSGNMSSKDSQGQYQPQSATLQKDGYGGMPKRGTINGSGQRNYTGDQQILDNYDFQLGLNKQRANTNKGAHGSINNVGSGLIPPNSASNPVARTEQSIQNTFTSSSKHFKNQDQRISGFAIAGQDQQHHQTFSDNVSQNHNWKPQRASPMEQQPSMSQTSSHPQSAMQSNNYQPPNSKIPGNFGGAFSNIYVGQALSAGHQNQQNYAHIVHQNQADQLATGIKGDIMENQLIQQKLKDMNGDLKEYELLGDQITAEIVNKLNKESPQMIDLNQHITSQGGSSQINVYNNFQQMSHGVQGDPKVSSSMQMKQGFANQAVPGNKIGRIQTAQNSKDVNMIMNEVQRNSIAANGGTAALSAQNRYQNMTQAGAIDDDSANARTQQQRNSRNASYRVQTASNNRGGRHGNKITNQYLQHVDSSNQSNAPKSNKNLSSSHIYNQQLPQEVREGKAGDFMHVQRIVPTHQDHSNMGRKTQSQSGQNGVTQIVNVHNQFNISNNIIINTNPSTTSHSAHGGPPLNQAPHHNSMPNTASANKNSRSAHQAGGGGLAGQPYPPPRYHGTSAQKKRVAGGRIMITQKNKYY